MPYLKFARMQYVRVLACVASYKPLHCANK